jgi:hypothetical protein
MTEERFECVRRDRRHVRLAQCAVDHRLELGACRGCEVGAQHAQLEPARAWPNGDRVRWIGELPIELVEMREVRRGSKGYAPATPQYCAPASVIAEARSDRPERPPLYLVRGGAAGEDTGAPRGHETTTRKTNEEDESMSTATAKTYEYKGRALTLRELLALPEAAAGLSVNALRQRVIDGWDLELALTAPKGAPRGTGKGAATAKVSRKLLGEQLEKTVRPSKPRASPKRPPKATTATTATEAPEASPRPLRVVWYAAGVQVHESCELDVWKETYERAVPL